jgi:hypothetical protein
MARQQRYRGSEYTRSNRRIVGSVDFHAVRVVSKKSRRLIQDFSVVFLGLRANAELLPKFHVALHVLHMQAP